MTSGASRAARRHAARGAPLRQSGGAGAGRARRSARGRRPIPSAGGGGTSAGSRKRVSHASGWLSLGSETFRAPQPPPPPPTPRPPSRCAAAARASSRPRPAAPLSSSRHPAAARPRRRRRRGERPRRQRKARRWREAPAPGGDPCARPSSPRRGSARGRRRLRQVSARGRGAHLRREGNGGAGDRGPLQGRPSRPGEAAGAAIFLPEAAPGGAGGGGGGGRREGGGSRRLGAWLAAGQGEAPGPASSATERQPWERCREAGGVPREGGPKAPRRGRDPFPRSAAGARRAVPTPDGELRPEEVKGLRRSRAGYGAREEPPHGACFAPGILLLGLCWPLPSSCFHSQFQFVQMLEITT